MHEHAIGLKCLHNTPLTNMDTLSFATKLLIKILVNPRWNLFAGKYTIALKTSGSYGERCLTDDRKVRVHYIE